MTCNLTCLDKLKTMKPLTLTHYGQMAEKHWREFCPKLVAELEAKGTLNLRLFQAERSTVEAMDTLRPQLIQQGYSPEAAHALAWELIRGHYLLLPPET